MKTKLHFLRAAFAILVMAGCGTAFHARADGSGSGFIEVQGDKSGIENFLLIAQTNNAAFGTLDNFRWVQNVSFGGANAYADLERNVVGGTNIYHTLHISGAAINSGFETVSDGADANAYSSVSISENMMIEYVSTDTPPTSVSFQMSYLVQGQLYLEFGDYGNQVNDSSGSVWIMNGQSDKPLGISVPISANVVGGAITENLNQLFSLENDMSSTAQWASSFPSLASQQSTYDLRLLFEGFVNIVDQNNKPVSLNKLIFYCVNSTNTTERIAFASHPNLAIEEAVTLEVIPGTNSLVLQWPSYATNYELETSTNLAGGWCTNSLPSPVQSGPFLQVTVSTTNSAAFFRLLQTN